MTSSLTGSFVIIGPGDGFSQDIRRCLSSVAESQKSFDPESLAYVELWPRILRSIIDSLDQWFEFSTFGESNDLFTGVTYQISRISAISITIHNSSKITCMK